MKSCEIKSYSPCSDHNFLKLLPTGVGCNFLPSKVWCPYEHQKIKKSQPSIKKLIYAKIILQRRNHVEPGNGFSVQEIRVVGSYLNVRRWKNRFVDVFRRGSVCKAPARAIWPRSLGDTVPVVYRALYERNSHHDAPLEARRRRWSTTATSTSTCSNTASSLLLFCKSYSVIYSKPVLWYLAFIFL